MSREINWSQFLIFTGVALYSTGKINYSAGLPSFAIASFAVKTRVQKHVYKLTCSILMPRWRSRLSWHSLPLSHVN